jgi:predicted dehydrogenase
MSTSRPLRGGIIGCGYFSQFQIEGWRRMPGVELAAACDLDIARARAAAPKAYSLPEAMLDAEELDFIDIATRPETHLELVRLTLGREIPTICQKPMAPTWQQCLDMVAAAESTRTRLMIHENWRWQPWYRSAKKLIEGGDLGALLTYRFRTCRNDGRGARTIPGSTVLSSDAASPDLRNDSSPS